jgi:hypothetical protein
VFLQSASAGVCIIGVSGLLLPLLCMRQLPVSVENLLLGVSVAGGFSTEKTKLLLVFVYASYTDE